MDTVFNTPAVNSFEGNGSQFGKSFVHIFTKLIFVCFCSLSFMVKVASVTIITVLALKLSFLTITLQRGAADKEIKVPSVENTELKGSPFEAWRRSVCCHASYTYCQGFLPC